MGLPPINFTGFSKFSESFQTVLERTFTVASLPALGLKTEQTVLEARQIEFGALQGSLQALQDAFASLGLLGAQGAVTASSSDTAVALVTTNGTVSPGTFDLNVTSAAAEAQEATLAGLADSDTTAPEADGIYKLTLGSTSTTIDLLTIGSGRTAGTTGSATPAQKVSVGVAFSNGLSGSITAELESFFVATAATATVGAGDTVSVTFQSVDGTISETIETAALSAADDATAIATALNTAITGNANLAGKVSFSDEGGALKLTVSDTAGTGFTFSSISTGTTVSGLEGGGVAGGQSAEEVALALNAQSALDAGLVAAGVVFTAVNGEIRVEGNQAFDIAVTDSAEGTGFVSGLAGNQSIAGFDNTLEGLRDYLNSDSALGVSAAIINTSSDPANPLHHLTITADDTGTTTLTLENSASANLLTSVNQGSNAVFTVNGLSADNSSNVISDFAPGLALTISGPGEATITAGDDVSAVSAKLTSLAASYNAVFSRIQGQVGEGAGILAGDILVREAQRTLRDVTGYSESAGVVQSIAALGLELSEEGLLTFNQLTFNSVSVTDFEAVRTFLGTTSTGFAGNAVKALDSLADPITGQIQTAVGFLLESTERINEQIAAAEERADRLIATLELQFAAADQLLANLESQQDLLTQLFDVAFGNRNS